MPDRPLPLAGVVVIEVATFVAGPSAGLALAQLGADVVRVDPIGGAVDINRWPIDDAGHSLYWSSLNRAKRSVSVDLRSAAGQEVVSRLICAPGAGRGILIDNIVGQDWLTFPALSALRDDLIHVHIEGRRGGTPAVDYTVNAEVGVPFVTGPEGMAAPVNNVLPAWDLITGMTVTTALLAALRDRDSTGKGAQITIALGDIAMAGVANLGWLSEARGSATDRERQANNLYGSYGRDFATSDGRYVMIVALTPRQWTTLLRVTGTVEAMAALESEVGVDFVADEAARYHHRQAVGAIVEPWFAARSYAEATAALDEGRVLWAPYRTLREAAAVIEGPLAVIDQPGIGEVVSAETPIRWEGVARTTSPASALGADTVGALTELAGVTAAELETLLADGVIEAP